VPIYFEASAGGGIPIIESLRNSLICNHIKSIIGIINGTSNYILSAMSEQGTSYSEALAKAQELGYAEADPSFDVNGWDAGHKALILAMLAYGTTIDPSKIYVGGIEHISPCDFRFADKLGYTIKLLVVIRSHSDHSLELRVQPSFVPKNHILASVNGVFNAIAVNGDIVGETLFYGRGAGKNPTSSAVISDAITAMRESRHPKYHTGFHPYSSECRVMDVDDTVTPYYVRFQVEDRTGVIADITSILARLNIGISGTSTSFDHETIDGRTWNNLVFILHACPWEQLQNALAGIILLPNVGTSPSVLRIEQFDSNSTPTI
jgi:homoserine dehydrogenase